MAAHWPPAGIAAGRDRTVHGCASPAGLGGRFLAQWCYQAIFGKGLPSMGVGLLPLERSAVSVAAHRADVESRPTAICANRLSDSLAGVHAMGAAGSDQREIAG